MLSPFGCAACGRGLYVLSGCLGKFCQAVALLIDMGKVLRACAIGVKGRKRLFDVRVYLPGAKDLIVFAVLDDKLMDIFVGIAQKIANFVGGTRTCTPYRSAYFARVRRHCCHRRFLRHCCLPA